MTSRGIGAGLLALALMVTTAACQDEAPGIPDDAEVTDAGVDSGPRPDADPTPRCGDGVIQAGEECDDGNLRSHDGCSSGCTAESPEWTEVTTATSPPPRWGAALAHDSARGRSVLFGIEPVNQSADTWEFDGTDWSETTPAVSPLARSNHGMAYDAARGRVVLFGGWTYQDPLIMHVSPETWEYDGLAWVDVTSPGSPPARRFHALAYDAARARVVLGHGCFSRLSCAGASEPDTWEYDGTGWLASTASQPPLRYSYGLAYDSRRGRVVLFGGTADGGGSLGDTWEYDGVSWVETTPAGSPPARTEISLAYDAARGRVVLFGGYELADTWEYDGAEWIETSPAVSPLARRGYAITWDTNRDRVLLFGGQGLDFEVYGDTWEYQWRTEWPDELCTGGADDDLDGLVDCTDPDCADKPVCTGTP